MKRLLLAIFSLTLAVILVEVLLRLFAPVYLPGVEEAYQYDPELGFRLRPGLNLLKTTDFQHDIHVNSLGTVNYQQNFAGYSGLVFAVGDSYTQGVGLPPDASYPFQLDLILNRDEQGLYHKKYAVVNLGTGGFGGEESLIILKRYATRLGTPRVILYLGSDNDYEDDIVFRSGYRHRHMVSGSPYWGKAGNVMRWLTYDTQIGLRIKTAYTNYQKTRLIERSKTKGIPAEQEQAIFQRLLQYSKQSGVVLIIGWADRGASYDWMKKWCGEKSVPFADWLSKIDSVRKAIPALPIENPHSAGHYRVWVNRIIAEEFARQIQQKTRDALQ